MEDDAFLWEEEPLRALTAQNILQEDNGGEQPGGQVSEEEEIKSPLGIFRRRPVIKRKKISNSGFGANLLPHPLTQADIQMSRANNLNGILNPHSPIVPELVQLDASQQLGQVLPQEIRGHVQPQDHHDHTHILLWGPEKVIL